MVVFKVGYVDYVSEDEVKSLLVGVYMVPALVR